MRLPVLAVLLSLATGGCASATWLARVNDEQVTPADLESEFVRRHGGHKVFLAGEVETRKFLDVVVDSRLLIQEAYRIGLQDQPDIAKASAGFRDQEAVALLLRREIDEPARPTPEEVRAAWEAHTTRLFDVREVKVDTAEKADAARARLLAGESFDVVAREVSLAPSRMFGGRLGPVGWGAQAPEWEEVVFELEPKALSPVFRTGEGWHIVRLESVREDERPPFDKARSRLEGILSRRKTTERKRALTALLWSKYHARFAERDRTPAALAAAHRESPDAPLASWDGGTLTVRDFFARLDMRELAAVPAGLAGEALEERMRGMVNEPLALLEARARGLDHAPEVEDATRRFREARMEDGLFEGYVLKDVTVTDDEVRAHYEQHRAELQAPEKRRVSHILVPTREEAQEIRGRLDQGESFEELVATRSKDAASLKDHGDLGWIVPKEVPADFAPVLKLAAGEVSPPLPSKFGYHLVKVVQIVPPRPLTWEEAQPDLKKKLLQQKQRERRATWVGRLRAASTIEVNRAGVQAFTRSSSLR